MIVQIDGKSVRVSDRVGRMVLWLIAKAEQISQMDKVRVAFSCSGRAIHTEVVEGGEA